MLQQILSSSSMCWPPRFARRLPQMMAIVTLLSVFAGPVDATVPSSLIDPTELVVTGTLEPDATGRYVADGTYNGRTTYRRVSDSAFYIWWYGNDAGRVQWLISTFSPLAQD